MENAKLGDCTKIISGFAFSASDFNKSESGLKIIRIQNVGKDSSREFVYWHKEYKEKFLIKNGDLLLSLSGSFRAEIWSQGESLLNQRIVKIIPKSNIHLNWFFHWLNNKLSLIERMGKHALVNNVGITDLKEMKISIPTLDEQKRIAAILDKANDIEETTEKSNEIRAELKNSIFFDLFGDLSINPHDFPEYDLSEIADFQEGPGILAVDFHDEGIPLLRLKGIENEFATLDGCNYLSPEKVEQKWEHFCVQKGDILIGSSASVGRVAIVDEDTIGAIPYTGIIRFRINEKLVNQAFVLALLRSDVFLRQVTRMSTGSTIKHFGPTHLKKVRLPVPPLNLQNELDKLFSSLNGIETTDVLAKVNSQSLSQNLLS